MDERKQREILNKLKEELNAFQKQCLLPLKILSKVCKNCILSSLFTNGEIKKKVRNEEVFTEGIKNFFKERCTFSIVKDIKRIDIPLKYKNENILILLEIKKTRESISGKEQRWKIAQKINEEPCYIEGTYFKMQNNRIETLVIKVDSGYYNLDRIGESQVVAYQYNMDQYNMKFSIEKNIIPVVYYLDKNELWYIKNIVNIENEDEFRLVKKDKKDSFIDCGIRNFEVLKVIAEKFSIV